MALVPYAGTASAHATIDLFDDNEEPDADLFCSPLADLKDEIELLKGIARAPGGTLYLPLAGCATPEQGGTLSWQYSTGAAGVYEAGWIQSGVAAGIGLRVAFDVDAPVGAVISDINVAVRGNWNGNTHAAVLPTTKPTVSLVHIGGTGLLTVDVAPLTDPSPDLATYETVHTINPSGLSVAVASGNRYQVLVVGETGGTAAANRFSVLSIAVSWNFP